MSELQSKHSTKLEAVSLDASKTENKTAAENLGFTQQALVITDSSGKVLLTQKDDKVDKTTVATFVESYLKGK